VLDTQTGVINRLPGEGRNCSAAWSPDGSRLAVGFGIGEYCGLHLITPDGSRSERLTDGAAIDFRPAWSPDGKVLAYVAYPKTNEDGENAGVFVIAPNGSGKKRLVNRAVAYVLWSPDGRMLLLQTETTARLIDPNGQTQVLLSAGAGVKTMLNAVFTPDGKRVIFCSDDSGIPRIFSSRLDGQDRKTITIRTSSSNFCLSPLLTPR
jgi:Tol biopolymer transport system component